MYTHAVSTSNFKYDDKEEKKEPIQKKQIGVGMMADSALDDISPVQKYAGDPLKDLRSELELENPIDDDEIVLNQDMELMFDKQLKKRDSDLQMSIDLKNKMDQSNREYELMMQAQKNEEVRLSLNLEKLKQEERSKAEIEKKQRELNELVTKHQADQEKMQKLQKELKERIDKEAIFEQQKKLAKEYMIKQQMENEQLREMLKK